MAAFHQHCTLGIEFDYSPALGTRRWRTWLAAVLVAIARQLLKVQVTARGTINSRPVGDAIAPIECATSHTAPPSDADPAATVAVDASPPPAPAYRTFAIGDA